MERFSKSSEERVWHFSTVGMYRDLCSVILHILGLIGNLKTLPRRMMVDLQSNWSTEVSVCAARISGTRVTRGNNLKPLSIVLGHCAADLPAGRVRMKASSLSTVDASSRGPDSHMNSEEHFSGLPSFGRDRLAWMHFLGVIHATFMFPCVLFEKCGTSWRDNKVNDCVWCVNPSVKIMP